MLPISRGFTNIMAATLLSAFALVATPAYSQPMSMGNQGGAGTTAAAGPTYKVGKLVVTAPWVRATPKGAPVGGGYLKITNTGSEPDRLVGGSLEGAARFEVHEMTMDKGIMRMRRMAKGLEIKPGQTVALKPGGYHLMFIGLKQQLEQGDAVKGTLQFEKAGRLDVTYQVGAIAASTAPMDMHGTPAMDMQR